MTEELKDRLLANLGRECEAHAMSVEDELRRGICSVESIRKTSRLLERYCKITAQ